MKITFFKKKSLLKQIIILISLLIILLVFSFVRNSDRLISAKEGLKLHQEDKIETLQIRDNYLRIVTKEKNFRIYKESKEAKELISLYPVKVCFTSLPWYEIALFLLVLIGFITLYLILKREREPILSKSPQKENESIEAQKSSITFQDVAGIDDVKEELEEIIDFLRYPQKYKKMGVRLPKGVLLSGPPGVGKTLISKALAGEAEVPFFYQSGASFAQIYVGMGAKRVENLFKKAKQVAPSIIFIDEIDAVGKKRGELRNDEREATLNELLTQMDGFQESLGVIVIGATNKIEVLDDALLRAGRFDRRIHISLPNLKEREKTLKLYLKGKPHNVNIEEIAKMTVGFSSASLDTLTNEAGINAMRRAKESIETIDFIEVKDKVLLGKKRVHSLSKKEKEIKSLYQGAKALIASWHKIEYEKIGVITTQFIKDEFQILSKQEILAYIQTYLAGTVATNIIYKEQFSNAKEDIYLAKELIETMLNSYAMGDSFYISNNQKEEIFDQSIKELTQLLNRLKEALLKTQNYLLENENITPKECNKILEEIF